MDNIVIEQSIIEKQYRYSKEVYLKVKEDIKTVSAEQPKLKAQRKQNFKGVKIEGNHLYNRARLSALHIVYDLVRGKDERVTEALNKFGHMKNGTFSDYVKRQQQMYYDKEIKIIEAL